MRAVFSVLLWALVSLLHAETPAEIKAAEREQAARIDPQHLLDPLDNQSFCEDEHPLKGLHAFTISCHVAERRVQLRKQVGDLMREELKKLGKVVRLEDGDLRGLALRNFLDMGVRNIENSEGKALSVIRVRLSLSTPVNLLRANTKNVNVTVWSTNAYVEGALADIADEKILAAVRKLLDQFIRNYRFFNPDQKEPPTFYCYFGPFTKGETGDKLPWK